CAPPPTSSASSTLSLHDALPIYSHIDHLRALLELPRRERMVERTFVHAFTDGRDVSPHAAADDLAELVGEGARIATVSGRYYARSEEHTSELQSPYDLVCRLLLE